MSACGGFGGLYTSTAFILVLYILLVIVIGGVFI
ncbi:YjcZ family sporulation protein [Paenibacillus sp. CC-CFT747]|nr:YjcZ family sporulation protein [Paenibacillus sp. CC-CFT747]